MQNTRPAVIALGIEVVDCPGGHRLDLDRDGVVADQVVRDLGGEGVVHLRRALVDVVAPDDQPLVPGPHHAHQPHADAAHVGAGLHDPVENGGPVCHVFRQIRLEDDVHRAADTHLAAERQPGIRRDLGIAAIGADQVLERISNSRPDRRSRTVVVTPPSSCLWLRYSVDMRVCAPREAAVLKRIGSMKVWGRSFMKHGEDAAVLRRHLGRRAPCLHAADLLARERSAEDVGAHQLLRSSVHHRLVLDLWPRSRSTSIVRWLVMCARGVCASQR